MRLALPLLLSLSCLGLGGCGQKGPLFIPSGDSTSNSQTLMQAAPLPQSTQPTQ